MVSFSTNFHLHTYFLPLDCPCLPHYFFILRRLASHSCLDFEEQQCLFEGLLHHTCLFMQQMTLESVPVSVGCRDITSGCQQQRTPSTSHPFLHSYSPSMSLLLYKQGNAQQQAYKHSRALNNPGAPHLGPMNEV